MKKVWIAITTIATTPLVLATDTVNRGFFAEIEQAAVASQANDFGIVFALVLLLLLLLYKALLEGR